MATPRPRSDAPETSTLAYRERPPAADLAAFVECTWSACDLEPRRDRSPEHIVPDGCPELVVHFSDRFARRIDGRFRLQPCVFLAGTLSRPWTLRAGAVVDTFGVRFRPGGLPGLVDLDMRSTVDREVPLAELVGAATARELVRRLAGAQSFEDRADASEAWLRTLPAPRPERSLGVTRTAVDRIRAGLGGERVEAVARELGVSRRQLERAFARDLGIGPKLYARIVRLQAALLALAVDQRAAGVDVALAAGYFDQSHLLRDFRGVAGRRPTRDRAADGELARHFTAPERLLALLAGE